MIPKNCGRLIELARDEQGDSQGQPSGRKPGVAFPIAEVSRQSAREKSIRHGHPSTLHLWWARRSLAACRAVLLALLWPDPCDPLCPEGFKRKPREVFPRTFGKGAPDDPLPLMGRTASVPLCGMDRRDDSFTARHKVALVILAGLVRGLPAETPRAQAVREAVTVVVDRCADKWASLVVWSTFTDVR